MALWDGFSLLSMVIGTLCVMVVSYWWRRHRQPRTSATKTPIALEGARFADHYTWLPHGRDPALPLQAHCQVIVHLTAPLKSRAVLLFVHDVGARAQHVTPLAARLARDRIACVSFDIEHHGLSSKGPRRCARRTLLDDDDDDESTPCGRHGPNIPDDVVSHVRLLAAHLRRTMDGWESIPFFVGGHGIGASIAILSADHAMVQQFEGLVLLAPALGPCPRVGTLSHIALRVLAACVPWMRVPLTGQGTRGACRNPAVALAHDADDLWQGQTWLSAHGAQRVLHLAMRASRCGPDVTLPFVMAHGGRDPLWNPLGAIDFYEAAPVSPSFKTFVPYPRAWHDLLHEPEALEVVEHVAEFIEGRLLHQRMVATLD